MDRILMSELGGKIHDLILELEVFAPEEIKIKSLLIKAEHQVNKNLNKEEGKMETRYNQQAKISKILKKLTDITPVPQDDEGNLDVKAFNQIPEIIQAKEELQKMGIKKNSDLSSIGFVAAALVLRF